MILTKVNAIYKDGVYTWNFPKKTFKWKLKRLISSKDKKMVYGYAYFNQGVEQSGVLIETNKQQDTLIPKDYVDKIEFSFCVKDNCPIGEIYEDVLQIEIELLQVEQI